MQIICLYMLTVDAMEELDGGVFAKSSLFKALESNALNIPPSKPLPQRKTSVAYVIVVIPI